MVRTALKKACDLLGKGLESSWSGTRPMVTLILDAQLLEGAETRGRADLDLSAIGMVRALVRHVPGGGGPGAASGRGSVLAIEWRSGTGMNGVPCARRHLPARRAQHRWQRHLDAVEQTQRQGRDPGNSGYARRLGQGDRGG
ncbi:MAG: hypothetical protein U0792_15120 [Gemmataceae bacterium]